MKGFKRHFAVLLAALLLLSLAPASASGITLTAVNDSFLPLTASSMPIRRSGELYVPYSVFTGTLGLRAFYDSQQQMLVMQGTSTTLTFSLSQSYVYDQNMNSFSSPAYSTSGGIFVPVRLICGQFGLSYSSISATGADVLRICNDNAVLSDHVFINSAASKIQDILDEYNNGTPADGSGTTAPEPPPGGGGGTVDPLPETPDIPADQPIVRPSLVYLAFAGAPNGNTAAILEVLHTYGRPSTFFLPAAQAWTGDLLRAIAADGHSFGLLLSAEEGASADAADAANERLRAATGLTTHIIMIDGGCHQLTQAQRDALIGAGYRLWDPTLTANDETQTARRTANLVLTSFAATSAPSVLRLHHTDETAAALSTVLRDMAIYRVASTSITLSDPPINLAGENR